MSIAPTSRRLVILLETEEGGNSAEFNSIATYIDTTNLASKLRKSNKKLGDSIERELRGLTIEKYSKRNMALIDKNDTNIRFFVHDSDVIITEKTFSDSNSHIIDITIGNTDKNYNLNPNDYFEYRAVIRKPIELYLQYVFLLQSLLT